LKINKISYRGNKDLANEIDMVNYYIRIYKNETNLGDSKISSSFRNKNPNAVYKINSNDKIASNNKSYFNLTINTDLSQNYFIDAIAEVFKGEIHEYLAYERKAPSIEIKEETKPLYKEPLFLVLISVGGFSFLLITILLICICVFRAKHKNLEKKVKLISFRNEREDENNDDDDDDDVLA